MRYKTPTMTASNYKFHVRRPIWLEEVRYQALRHGDKIEIIENGMDFQMRLTCPHKARLDKKLK